MITIEYWMIVPFVIAGIATWYHRKVEQEAFEDGIEYAIVMYHKGVLTYESYENEDGDECLEIKMKGSQ